MNVSLAMKADTAMKADMALNTDHMTMKTASGSPVSLSEDVSLTGDAAETSPPSPIMENEDVHVRTENFSIFYGDVEAVKQQPPGCMAAAGKGLQASGAPTAGPNSRRIAAGAGALSDRSRARLPRGATA